MDVQALAALWSEALRGLASCADGTAVGGFTPSDLSVEMSQEEIDELEAELNFE